ncbi:hypothetical protein PIB30_094207 [Stylosanthes scabra]|uniref:Uncharacterized protein n=1 Tax=Stylosanthes scabra TaxID=79078 RepID=A0ABU6QVJ9_9FABA|nr:hypothetical protein [Stylosanthes scabra]
MGFLDVELGLRNGWALAWKSEIPKIGFILVSSAAAARACDVLFLGVTKWGGADAPSRSRGRATNRNFPIKEGRARAPGQCWIGLFLAFCPFSLLLLFFLASLGLFVYTLGLKFTSTHIKAPRGRRFKQFTHMEVIRSDLGMCTESYK